MNDISEVKSAEVKESKDSFSFSKEEDGITKSVSGREVENGWIIDINKSWTSKDDRGYDKYECDHKTYISKDNPMEKIKDKKGKKEDNDVSEMMSSLSSLSGMLSVD
jgi:hypothetical protein